MQGQELSLSIQRLGGHAIDVPAIAIETLPFHWLAQLPALTQVDQAIFISTNAVNNFFATLKEQRILWPWSIQVTAVGNATAKALEAWSIHVHHHPATANSEHLLNLAAFQRIHHQTILLIKGDGGRALIEETLQHRQAQVIPVAVYRRILPTVPKEYMNSLWRNDGVDIILFTSQQAMHNLFTLFGEQARSWLCSKFCLVISERLEHEARLLGMRHIVTCRYDNIVDTLLRMKNDTQQ